jgi:hypothetical protein
MPEIQVPEIEVPEEQMSAYEQGIRDGENYGANGYPIEPTCYDLEEGHNWMSTAGHTAERLIEVYGIIHTLRLGKLLAAGFEGGILVLMLAITVPTHFNLPTQVLDASDAQSLVDLLSGVEDPLSFEVYFGGGVDYNVEGCQLKISRLYKSADWARQDVQAMGRPAYLLLALRSDMSGGPRVVEEVGTFIQ